MLNTFWKGLGTKGRVGLIAGAVCIVACVAAGGFWLLRTDYQVLFADLTAQDTAAMTAELERLKVPYTLAEDGNGGTTILVEAGAVHRTRIKLMGRDIPLHGGVGFELFNNSDFGMTEFTQKINYQRALQGELTRTILSLSEIREARVLLALPEQGLFKQPTSKPKASITVSLKHGQALRPEQVTGIQRLVSAAVPGIATQDVTIVDQTGVALTRASGDGEAEASSGRLDLKRETEAYLSRKAIQVLERAVGQGQALVSVDVTLDMNKVHTTTEDFVGAPQTGGHSQRGVVVRERATARGATPPLDARGGGEAGAGSSDGSSQREVEYAVGHRVEQVIGQPGSIRRLNVVAVVRKQLDAPAQRQMQELVAASVGASAERGDTVVVQAMSAIAAAPAAEAPALAASAAVEPVRPAPKRPRLDRSLPSRAEIAAGAAAIVAIVAFLVALSRRRRATAPASKPLSELERQVALAQLRAWVAGGETARTPRNLS